MDIQRILAQVDGFFEQNKGAEAEKLMQQSIVQAVQEEDDGSLLQLLNELLSYYRETSQRENADSIAAQAIAQAKRMGLEGTIPYATTLLNVANACRACGRLEASLDYYAQVQEIYDRELPPDSMLVAGLKNNISLLYQELGDFTKAKESLLQALRLVEQKDEPYEIAVTHANLAGTCVQLGELEEAYRHAAKAVEGFRSRGVSDSHYGAALAALGACHYAKKEYGEALRCYREAMESVERSLGRNEYYNRLQEYVAECERKVLQGAADEPDGEVRREASQDEAELSSERNVIVEQREAESSGKGSGNTEAEGSGQRVALQSAAEAVGEPDGAEAGTGLRLARSYYEAYGRQMIEEKFPEYAGKIAIGLAGRGSDCFGWDDLVSRDHDWGPGFCMWVSDGTYEAIGDALQAAYDALPANFQGFCRAPRVNGKNRRGVIKISEFYRSLVGADTYEGIDWRSVSDASLAAAVNGQVFRDDEGIFSAFRDRLQQGYPEDILYLKLAESAAKFAQAAQYNFPRMHKRGDSLTAQMMLWDGVREAMKLQHYIEGKFPPHDKWLRHSLLQSEAGREAEGLLRGITGVRALCLEGTGVTEHAEVPGKAEGAEYLGSAEKAESEELPGNAGEAESEELPGNAGKAEGAEYPGNAGKARCAETVQACIEKLGAYFARELYGAGFISDTDSYLDAHSEELVYKASLAAKSDGELVGETARLEFEAFDKVHNEGGRASCQNDWRTFSIMRKSQYLTWNRLMLMQYLYDFHREYHRGHNLIEEKYGRMMESTAPGKYEEIKNHFPPLTEDKKRIIEQICGLQVAWMEEFAAEYPALADNARSIHTSEDNPFNTSYETYLRGELGTYSDKMLELYGRYVVEYARSGRNPARDIMENSIKMYGYKSIEEAEEKTARAFGG